MEIIIKYKANDGSEWNSEFECVSREQMIMDVEKAMSVLKPHPTELNWDGYVQHDPKSVLECRRSLFEIANKEGILKWWIDSQKADHGKTEDELIQDCHPSWFQRMLDGDNGPLNCGYSRLSCIDENLQEWNQPYYAMNSGTGEDVCRG